MPPLGRESRALVAFVLAAALLLTGLSNLGVAIYRSLESLLPSYGSPDLLAALIGLALSVLVLLVGRGAARGPARDVWHHLAVAASWVAYGLRVLSRRRPLLASREVIAGRMGVLFSALFTAGTMAVGWVNAGVLRTPATTLGATMLLVAIANLARAHWRRSRLTGRQSLPAFAATTAGDRGLLYVLTNLDLAAIAALWAVIAAFSSARSLNSQLYNGDRGNGGGDRRLLSSGLQNLQ